MTRVVTIAIAAAVLACAGSRPEERAQPAGGSAEVVKPAAPGAQGAGPVCPMDVPDTTVAASDTGDGEALTFTTRSGQVDELRRRVRALAAMHDRHAATQGSGDHADHHPDAGDHRHGPADHPQGEPAHHMRPPPSHATVEDVDGGARVLVTPVDPAQLGALRAATRMHVMHMQHHGCQMMH